MADTLSLFATAASPVLQAGLLAATGAAMAWHGTLADEKAISIVAALCFYLFTPALTFTTLASTISLDSIRHWWPLLANMTLSCLVGLAIGHLVSLTLCIPRNYRKLVLVAIAFGNVGNLPLVFVGALCADSNSIFFQKLGDQCTHRGVSYTAADICIATLFQFTLAIYLLSNPKNMDVDDVQHEYRSDFLGTATATTTTTTMTTMTTMTTETRALIKHPTVSDLLLVSPASPPDGFPQRDSLPHRGRDDTAVDTPLRLMDKNNEIEIEMTSSGHGNSAYHYDDDHGDADQEQSSLLPASSLYANTTTNNTNTNNGIWSNHNATQSPYTFQGNNDIGHRRRNLKWMEKVGRCCWVGGINWRSVLPLPTQAAFGGVIFGCVPFLRSAYFSAYLRPLRQTLELLGQGLIPAAIPLLGAVLFRGPQSRVKNEPHDHHIHGISPLPHNASLFRVTLVVVVVRLVLLPLLLTGGVVLLLKGGVYKPVPDPMFLLTMLLSNATPTAINMLNLTILYGGSDIMSRFLFVEYLVSLITLPCFMWLFLAIISWY